MQEKLEIEATAVARELDYGSVKVINGKNFLYQDMYANVFTIPNFHLKTAKVI